MSGFTIPNTPDAFNQNQAEPDSLDFQILGKQNNGVVNGMAVTVANSTAVSVESGEILVSGGYYSFSGIASLAVTSYASSNFFDIVVARLDIITSTVSAVIIPGNSGTNPRFPASVNHATDVVLATIWRDGASIVSNAIVDKRVFTRSNAVRTKSDTISSNRGTTGDLYVNTAWSPSSSSTSSPLSVKVGSSWYNLAYWPANGSITTTGNITATTFIGNLTGNVTGNVSGNAGSVTNGVYNNGGTYSINISGTSANSNALSGYGLSTGPSANTIVLRDSLGNIYANFMELGTMYVNTTLSVNGGFTVSTLISAQFGSTTLLTPNVFMPDLTTTTSSANMRVLTNGRIVYNTSLRKYKEDIQNFDDALEIINSLTPRTFKVKTSDYDGPVEEHERKNSIQHGFIVEEVLEVAPYLIEYGIDSDKSLSPRMWKTNDVISILTRAVQQLDTRVKELENVTG